MNIKEYVVFEFGSSEALQEAVNAALSDGFTPVGGVSVTAVFESYENERKGYAETNTDYIYVQAAVKYHDD